jgi:agmatinase
VEDFSYYVGAPFVFGGEQAELGKAKAVLFGFPFDSTVSFKPGTRFGPNALREASLQYEGAGVKTHDLGDMWVTPGNVEKTLARVTELTAGLLKLGKVPFGLGGEHTLSLGMLRAFPRDTAVVQFDAQPDLLDEYQGDRTCHVSAFRRVLDFLPKKNLIQVGVRDPLQEEKEFIRKKKITSFTTEQARASGFSQKLARLTKGKRIYLSVDIDVLDPSIAPATGTPVPGGLTYAELSVLLSSISGRIVGADLCEVCRDPEYVTQLAGARLAYEVLNHLR